MNILINNQRLSLKQGDVIGIGGEGTVYKTIVGSEMMAVKIYHQPDSKRSLKLQAFQNKPNLNTLRKVAAPRFLALDPKGQKILGLAVTYLGNGFEEIASLSNKKYRAAHLINTKSVADIFIDGWQTIEAAHSQGFVIGDFNDLNALFRLPTEMLFIDVDSWQFDSFACPVATEQFLAPELYGIDLSKRPVFKPEHDWYSYAVMLFKSLLYTHPYGGIHKDLKQLTTRAQRKVTVLDSGVTYPKIALSPDLLSDDLAELFSKIFGKGQRGKFPLERLREYQASLVPCNSCGTYYPSSRKACPICSAATLIIIGKPSVVTKGIVITEFLRTNGPIVFHKLIGQTLYVIAYESGKAVLYKKVSSGPIDKKVLFDEIPGARYELTGETLVVNLPGQTELLLLDLSGGSLRPITRTETNIFAPNRRASFRASSRYLFRVVGGHLMYGELVKDQLVEHSLRPVMNNQTWFSVKPDDSADKPTAFGFFQINSEQMFWLTWEGRNYDNLPLSHMEVGETLVDILVRFAGGSVLVRRETQYQGVEYLRTELIDDQGHLIYSSPRLKAGDHPTPKLHGQAYATGKLLHATDEGVIQEDLLANNTKTFEATKGYVQEGDALHRYQNGLLVVTDKSVKHLVLS